MRTFEYKENSYTLMGKCSFKNPETRQWIPAVRYSCHKSGEMYVREAIEFFTIFVETTKPTKEIVCHSLLPNS